MRNFAEFKNSVEEIFKGGAIRELPITRVFPEYPMEKQISNIEKHSRPSLRKLFKVLWFWPSC